MISSIDLFFSRDCALGAGPDVELPRAFAAGVGAVDVVVCVVVGGFATVDEALPNKLVAEGALIEGAAAD